MYHISSLFEKAYNKAATVGNAVSGFKATGICPLNPNIFPDHLFAPSLVTPVEEDNGDENIGNTNLGQNSPQKHNMHDDNQPGCSEDIGPTHDDNQPGCLKDVGPSCKPGSSASIRNDPEMANKSIQEILEEIHPKPIAKRAVRKAKKEPQSVLTISPYVNELKECEIKKREKETRKSNRARVTKQVFNDTDDETEPFANESDDEDDAACIYCNELFSRSRPNEQWIKCQSCKMWAHTDCADVPRKIKQFICDACKD